MRAEEFTFKENINENQILKLWNEVFEYTDGLDDEALEIMDRYAPDFQEAYHNTYDEVDGTPREDDLWDIMVNNATPEEVNLWTRQLEDTIEQCEFAYHDMYGKYKNWENDEDVNEVKEDQKFKVTNRADLRDELILLLQQAIEDPFNVSPEIKARIEELRKKLGMETEQEKNS